MHRVYVYSVDHSFSQHLQFLVVFYKRRGGVELDQQIHRMALENVKDGINFKTLFAQVLKL